MASEAERLRGVKLTVAGNPASEHDTHQFITVSILRYGLEADLCGFTSIEQCAYRRVLHSIKELDLKTYAQDLKQVKTCFIAQLQAAQELCSYPDFKRRVARLISTKWVLVMLGRLWGSPRACLQWLSFDERLLLTTNDKLIASEVLDYVEFEDEMAQRTYDRSILESLSLIIRDWFSDFSLGEFKPDGTFGPGAVAGVKGRPSFLEKARTCVWDPDVVELFAELYDCDVDEVIPGVPAGSEDDLYRNRIIFRPKNALKHRIISAEPAWLSWLQQDLKGHLYPYVERHPRINTWFSNQERSRELALRGSVDGSYATIDFSNASDSVHKDVVDQVFQYTYFHDALLAVRSREAKLPYQEWIVRLDKYAPMGSATCFWTMDVLLCACCELACRVTLGREAQREDYVVYGDDVILRAALVDPFLRIVSALGMSTNADKSYWNTTSPHYYRESCGIEAVDGQDCTPIRYSRFQEPIYRADVPSDGPWLESVVSLMNQALLAGYWNMRSAIIELLRVTLDRASADADPAGSRAAKRMRHVWDRLLRVDASDYLAGVEGPCCVVVPDGTATNYRCRSRWNADLQRREVLVCNFSARPVRTYKTDGYWDDPVFYALWFFRARTVLTGETLFARVLETAAGVDSQQWRSIWAPT
jgi:hypothetical protein